MSGFVGPLALAPSGTTGNNTHASVQTSPAARAIAVVLIVEAAGATPTITAKIQGSLDPPGTPDAQALWFDLIWLPAGSETATASDASTAVGAKVYFLAQSSVRFARRIRIITSLNTNITYRAELHQVYN